MHGLNSFTYFATNHWNLLPDNVRTASNILGFIPFLDGTIIYCNAICCLFFKMMYIVVNSHLVKIIFNIIIYCTDCFINIFVSFHSEIRAAMLLFNPNVEIKFIYLSIYTIIILNKSLLIHNSQLS